MDRSVTGHPAILNNTIKLNEEYVLEAGLLLDYY